MSYSCYEVFLISNLNICCDPSLEPSWWDGYNDSHNLCFYGKVRTLIPKLFLLPPIIIRTASENVLCCTQNEQKQIIKRQTNPGWIKCSWKILARSQYILYIRFDLMCACRTVCIQMVIMFIQVNNTSSFNIHIDCLMRLICFYHSDFACRIFQHFNWSLPVCCEWVDRHTLQGQTSSKLNT